MVHQWGFFGSISAIRKIWSLTANSRSLQAAALKRKSSSCSNLYCTLQSNQGSHFSTGSSCAYYTQRFQLKDNKQNNRLVVNFISSYSFFTHFIVLKNPKLQQTFEGNIACCLKELKRHDIKSGAKGDFKK